MNLFDELDSAIVAEFQADGRQSNREVARKLNISEGTVRQRLARLQELRAIRFDVVTDAAQMGVGFIAYLRLSVTPDKLEAALDACARIAELWYLAAVLGRYNIMAIITAESAAAATHIIHNDIATLPGVVHVDVRQVLRSMKHDYREMIIPDE